LLERTKTRIKYKLQNSHQHGRSSHMPCVCTAGYIRLPAIVSGNFTAAVGGKFNEALHFADRDSGELLGFHFPE